VRRQDDGEWVFGDGGHDRCHHLVPGQRVQVRQRFIQQQQFRAFGQSQGQRNLGVLTPGQFPDPPVQRDVQPGQPTASGLVIPGRVEPLAQLQHHR